MFKKAIPPFLLLFFWLVTFGTVNAQAPPLLPLDIPKGKFVVLKIPAKLVGFERISYWKQTLNYGAVVEASTAGGLLVGGLGDWKSQGWPLMLQLTVEKVSREKNYTAVQLQHPLAQVNIRFDNSVKDLNAAFREVAFVGLLSEFESSEYYQKDVMDKVLPKIFVGSLEALPASRKLNLLKEIRFVDAALATTKYKGDTYLSVDVGGDTEIYNTIRIDQQHRLADSLNKRVLAYFKRIGRIIKFAPNVGGIRIAIRIPYKNFVTDAYVEPESDRIEIYASMDAIKQFSEDDLTNQEFVDECIVLVNGNRIRLSNMGAI